MPREAASIPHQACGITVSTRAVYSRNFTMNVRRNSSVSATVTSPSASMSPGVKWMYASGVVICRALRKLSVLRSDCWPTAVPIWPGRGADDGSRLVGPGVLAPGAAPPVDGVLQRTGKGPVVLGRHEQQRVGRAHRRLEVQCHLRIVGVEIAVVQRQIVVRDLEELELGRCQALQRRGQAPVDGLAREAADDDADAIGRFVLHDVDLHVDSLHPGRARTHPT